MSGKIYTYNFVLAINTNDVITFTVNTTAWGSGSTTDVQVRDPFFCEITLDNGNVVNLTPLPTFNGVFSSYYVEPYKTSAQIIELGPIVTSIEHQAMISCKSLKSVIIPNTVTSIGDYAFCSTGLTSIDIPEGVTSIGSRAFLRCASLKSVIVPNSVTSIGEYAFGDDTSLTSITIPDGVTSIGGYAFAGCSKLSSITISNSVTSIGGYTFMNCKSGLYVNYTGTISEWNAISKGGYWNYTSAVKVIHCTDGDIEI